MKIGLIFDDKGLKNLELDNPDKGNPGVGGTQFCFLMLTKYIKIVYPEIDVIIYHYNKNKFYKEVKSELIQNIEEGIKKVKYDKVDILIFSNIVENSIYRLIKEYKINSVLWAHNYLFSEELKLICDNEYLKRVIFVGRQQYDRYIDHPIIDKSQYIYNMFNSRLESYKRYDEYNNIVTYTGSIVKSKGFHILAKAWKNIIKEVPNAKLYVIGSGALYNRNSKLGKYNIAEEKYENKFIKYLIDESGSIIPSVKFLGILGSEKDEIYKNTAVGIINPSANTETYGLGAVEMESCGIPIVTKNKNGLPDTVINNVTGLLFNYNRGIEKRIINLLKDREFNEYLGRNGREFVFKEFQPEKLITEWYKLFNDIINDKKPKYIKPNNHYMNNNKFIRMINRELKKIKIFSNIPAIVEYECYLKNITLKLKKLLQELKL